MVPLMYYVCVLWGVIVCRRILFVHIFFSFCFLYVFFGVIAWKWMVYKGLVNKQSFFVLLYYKYLQNQPTNSASCTHMKCYQLNRPLFCAREVFWVGRPCYKAQKEVAHWPIMCAKGTNQCVVQSQFYLKDGGWITSIHKVHRSMLNNRDQCSGPLH